MRTVVRLSKLATHSRGRPSARPTGSWLGASRRIEEIGATTRVASTGIASSRVTTRTGRECASGASSHQTSPLTPPLLPRLLGHQMSGVLVGVAQLVLGLGMGGVGPRVLFGDPSRRLVRHDAVATISAVGRSYITSDRNGESICSTVARTAATSSAPMEASAARTGPVSEDWKSQ